MTWALHATIFALGICLSIRIIAALHGIIDFWHAIGTEYPRVIRGILGWGIMTLAIGWLVEGSYWTALVSGLSAYFLFYLSLYPLWLLLLRVMKKRSKNRSRS